MYKNRIIEKTITNIKNEYPVITIYGARQVGKSTMNNYLFADFNYVSLDKFENKNLALTNPRLFLETFTWPLVIDEIQKAPILLDEIKDVVDEEKKRCIKNDSNVPLMYVLTGSNQFELKRVVSESLSGRTAIFNMSSLSNAEINNIDGDLFDPNIDILKEKYKKIDINNLYKSRKDIFVNIFNGGMPDYIINHKSRETYFSSYIDTYIDRDIRGTISIDKEREFRNFLQIMALRTAQQINYDDISRSVGIDSRTVKSWISLLVTSGIAITLESYAKNLSDRVTKMEKFYFLDTGLCSFLCKWQSPEMLENGIMNGAIYETYVISEIVKSYINAGINFEGKFFYYRDRDNKEADFIIEYADSITPIEIKKGINPLSSNFNFNYLKKYNKSLNKGIVIDSRKDIFPLNEEVSYCPIFMIGL